MKSREKEISQQNREIEYYVNGKRVGENAALRGFHRVTGGIKNFWERQRAKMRELKELDPKSRRRVIRDALINNALYILLILFIILVFSTNPKFLSFSSVVNIITQASSRLIMALGVAGIIVLTGTDLSAGRTLGLCACICASLLQSTDFPNKMYAGLQFGIWLIPVVLILSMTVGSIVGAFNGFCVAKFQLHPFIVTLSTQLILYGLVMIYVGFGSNHSAPIAGLDSAYTNFILGGISIAGVRIPMLIFYAAFVTVIMWFVWNKTKLGKNMYAVGCNPEAATVSGVSVFKTVIFVFMIAGMLYGVSAFIESARIGSNSTLTGVNYELDAIAACVIGGVSFMGGIGKIRGVIMGVVLLQLVNVGLVFLRFDAAAQTIVKGAIILIACAIDMRKYLVRK